MAIFATLTGMLFFIKKEWKIFWIKVIIIMTYGFLFAILTELIQLTVPGRNGAFTDVFIDYSGYLTSSIIIVIIFYVNYSKYINKKTIENSQI